jgi:hypothetical protein
MKIMAAAAPIELETAVPIGHSSLPLFIYSSSWIRCVSLLVDHLLSFLFHLSLFSFFFSLGFDGFWLSA